jgi:hypothetical protein
MSNDTAKWMQFYGDMKEEDPQNMLPPLGRTVSVTVFVEADHGSNVVTRRSPIGYLPCVMNALMTSFRKKQIMFEASTYGPELVARRIVPDIIVEMRIKYKRIGLPLVGATEVYCDS